MIRIDCEQGSTEWLRARVGVPTASGFSRIITAKTWKVASGMTTYAHEILAEMALGVPLEDASSGFMARGTEMEQEARTWYELQRDCDVERVGFLLRDDERVGCSPDGLVGEDGGVEIKCPAAHTHVGYLLGEDFDKYYAQMQGCMWLTDRKWWDFVSYHPTLPPLLKRIERDEKFIEALRDAVEQFLVYLDRSCNELAILGCFPGDATERQAA